MALVVADRVKETTTSTGTGAISLAGAEPNFRTFSSVLSDADTTYYAIIDDSNLAFEVGLGTYASSGNTITRTTVLSSSNSNNAVNFSAGTKDVFINYPAGKSAYLDGSAVTSTAAELNKLDGFSGDVGFRPIPAVGTKTSAYTLATGDVGKYVQVGSSGSIVIPNATFSEGDVVAVFNNTAGDITITCTITTAYIGGTDADKATVTLATRGICNILFISGTVCVITGNIS